MNWNQESLLLFFDLSYTEATVCVQPTPGVCVQMRVSLCEPESEEQLQVSLLLTFTGSKKDFLFRGKSHTQRMEACLTACRQVLATGVHGGCG